MASISNARDLSLTKGLGPEAHNVYKYTPLPTNTSIRAIEWPRSLVPTSDLRCKLRTIDLDDPNRPPYTGISYTWGAADGTDAEDVDTLDSLFTNMVVCDDQLLRVTENAHTALSQLRWRGRAHLFWLDAICVNQQDLEERSEQVALMGRIFAEAERTIVWLGECDQTTEKFYREHSQYLLEKDAWALKRRWQLPEVKDSLNQGIGLAEFLALIPLHNLSVDVDGVQAFFARNWFQRLWVIQEVVLAKDLWIFCGGYSFNWEGLTDLIDNYKARVDVMGQGGLAQRAAQGLSTVQLVAFLRGDHSSFRNLALSTFGYRTGVEEYCATLATLIQAFTPSAASDVRDRIYAPLALTNQICKTSPEMQFMPDYERSVETTFYDIAVFILKQAPTLSYLSLCKAAPLHRPRVLPSWVPDFRSRSQQKPLSWLTDCNATGGWESGSKLSMPVNLDGPFPYASTNSAARHVIDGNCLRVFGRNCSSIMDMLDPTKNLTNIDIVTLLTFITEFGTAKGSSGSLEKVLRALITAGSATAKTETLPCEAGKFLDLFQPSKSMFESWLRLKLLSAFYEGTFTVGQMMLLLNAASDAQKSKGQKVMTRRLRKKLESFLRANKATRSKPSFDLLTELNSGLQDIWQGIPWEKLCSYSSDSHSLEPLRLTASSRKDQESRDDTPDFFDDHLRATIFRDALVPYTTDRTIFATTDGKLGLAPRQSQPGDQIWFVRGCKAPLVLRPVDQENGFELIGEVYLMGYMNGLISQRYRSDELQEIRLI